MRQDLQSGRRCPFNKGVPVKRELVRVESVDLGSLPNLGSSVQQRTQGKYPIPPEARQSQLTMSQHSHSSLLNGWK